MSWLEKPAGRLLIVVAPTFLMLSALAVVFGNDEGVVDAMFRFRKATPALSAVLESFTQWSGVPFYIAYALVFVQAARRRDRESALFVGYYLVSLAATLFLVYCLKVVVSRPRPFIDGDHEGLFSFNRKFHSFPSNHASETFATTVPFALRFRGLPLALGVGAFNALAGFARIYLGAHYPTDVLGALVAGCGVTLVCASLARSLFARRGGAGVPVPARRT